MDNTLLKPFSILYAEDDDMIRDGYTQYLKHIFQVVYEAKDGKEAYKLYNIHKPDILLFDINMPYLSGLEVIQMIRLKDKDVKIIISTAHAEEEKLLQAIPLGLSSYLKKPVKERELRDVLRSVIYELEQKTNNILKFSQTFYWDTQENILYNNLNKIHLTRNELTLMQILSSQPSLHLSLDDILEKFWQYQSQKDMTENSVRNIIKRLKQKLPIDTIENYYGVGYKLCTTK